LGRKLVRFLILLTESPILTSFFGLLSHEEGHLDSPSSEKRSFDDTALLLRLPKGVVGPLDFQEFDPQFGELEDAYHKRAISVK
jgi:hypothetical protein